MSSASTACVLSDKNPQEALRVRLRKFASKPPEEMGDEWGLFLEELGLTNSYYLAVVEVLRQGRWATAENPRAYVKKAATIEARKMHLSIPHKDDTLESGDPHLVFMGGNALDKSSTREATKKALVAENREHGKPPIPPMKGKHFVREQYGPEYRINELLIEENKPRPDALYLRQVEEFNRSQNERHIHVQPKWKLDWERLAREAGFDSWEIKVLSYRKVGMSRDVALSQQPDEISRKALQAAWKRFDRTGMKRLQECTNKNLQKCPD